MGGACRDKECIQKPSRKTLRKRPLGRPRRRCEINIKMDLKKIGP
jgi:hypothetical protein